MAQFTILVNGKVVVVVVVVFFLLLSSHAFSSVVTR